MSVARLRRRLGKIAFGLAIAALLAAIILLLPILLPAVAVSEAWTVRKLARTKCVNCGEPIGLAEIQRAQREAVAKGQGIVNTVLASGRRPRIVVVWDVTCPTCGHRYAYRPGAAQRPALVSKELESSEQTT